MSGPVCLTVMEGGGGVSAVCQCCGGAATLEFGPVDEAGEFVRGAIRLCDECQVAVWSVLDDQFDQMMARVARVKSRRAKGRLRDV